MTDVVHSRVEDCVEVLCEHGCERVLGYIVALQARQTFTEVAGLSAAERLQVLAELESVMAPYRKLGE